MKLSIGRKLAFAFGVVVLMLVFVAIAALYGMDQMRVASERLIRQQDINAQVFEADEAADEESLFIFHYVTSGDKAMLATSEREHEAHTEAFAALKQYIGAHDPAAIQRLDAVFATYDGLLADAVKAYQANPNDQKTVYAKLTESGKFFDESLVPAVEKIGENEAVQTATVATAARQLGDTLRIVIVLLSLSAFVVALIAATVIGRGITRAASHLSAAAASISRGNLDEAIQIKTGDEMEVLAESIERMRASLKSAIERMRVRRAT